MHQDAGTRTSEAGGALQGNDQDLLRIYRVAVTARAVDQRLDILARQGRVSFVLTARGHEIAQAASAAALRPGRDSAWLYYRDMAVALALGVTPFEIFLGAMGRADDPHSGGRQLTAHFSSPRLRIGSVSSEVASHLPHAVGAAYAERVFGHDAIAMCWFGDGATSEGDTHEAMNWAAVHGLPVVFVCENNGYAISTPEQLQLGGASLVKRAQGYAMPAASLDGTDAAAVLDATRAAVQRARQGAGPSFLELGVPRIMAHSSQDDDTYRSEAERAQAVAADPLPRLRQELIDRRLLTEAEDAQLRRTIGAEVLADADRATARPEPDPARARRWLFAGDPPHPYLAALERGLTGSDLADG